MDPRVALVELSALTVVDGEPLPTEFQIFASGINETEQGPIDFNAQAAQEIMAARRLSSARCMIDLEHDSLHPERRAQRADAGDARGWFSLVLRTDGSLWASDVEWSPDGERRLRERTQAYISPAALTTVRDGVRQPFKLLNVALCAMPAMYDAKALVAASSVIDLRTPQERATSYVNARKVLSMNKAKHGS